MITHEHLEILVPHAPLTEDGTSYYEFSKVLDLVNLFNKNIFDVSDLKYNQYKTVKFGNKYLHACHPLDREHFNIVKNCYKKALSGDKDYQFMFKLPPSYRNMSEKSRHESYKIISNAFKDYAIKRIDIIDMEIEKVNAMINETSGLNGVIHILSRNKSNLINNMNMY